jgi:Antitoxin Xre/MbcA/ParS C-terminal toxin-binding domain
MRLFDALSELVDPKAIASWLKTSNPSFEGSTPLQIIERGETDRLWRMIWQLESGNSG